MIFDARSRLHLKQLQAAQTGGEESREAGDGKATGG